MKILKISLLPESSVEQVWPLVATSSLAIALTAVGWLWNAYEGKQAAFQELQAQMLNLRKTEYKPAKPVEKPYMADALRAADEARFDTSLALTALEKVQVQGVLPESVALEAASATSRVVIEYLNPDSLLKYIGDLNAGESPDRWTLIRETSKAGMPINGAVDGESNGGAGKSLIEARWK